MTGIGVDLLGVIAVGIGAAAMIYAAMHLLRKLGLRPARWLLPAGIGLAMVSYSVWNDYAWLDRAVSRLPQGSALLLVGHDSQPWAPWTYLFPIGVRAAALDPASIVEHDDGTIRAEIMLLERRGPTLIVPQDFDCVAGMVRLPHSDWKRAAPDDPAVAFVCSQALHS